MAVWRSKNSLVTAWLINLMEPTIGKPHMFLPTAKDVWEAELDLCYEDDWECPNDSIRHKKREESDRVYVFLAGLNQDLDEVRGRILGRKPLPSIREVFSKVRREEKRRQVMIGKKESDAESSTLMSKGARAEGEDKNSKMKPWCDHCKRPWHTRDACWKIHGKPSNWKKKTPVDNRASQANVSESRPEATSGMPSFTNEQIEQICKLLQSQNLNDSNPSCSLV
ncbi:uncharacterized protein LOC112090754 [Morus notabilis]|uniref:uncharacterized protein LOC112090754 n=1 Tax=Morus notabilis TaxID=981085 RepID=UPI000CED69E6|nr:uncharacterized protein LOC112090754 [Morus notabilis]